MKYFKESFEYPIFFYESLHDSYFKVQRPSNQLIESYKMEEQNFENSGHY
jgi:hypothetical protein